MVCPIAGQAADHGRAGPAGAGVGGDADRLVHHDDVVVGVDHPQAVHRLGDDLRRDGRRRQRHLQPGTGADLVGLGARGRRRPARHRTRPGWRRRSGRARTGGRPPGPGASRRARRAPAATAGRRPPGRAGVKGGGHARSRSRLPGPASGSWPGVVWASVPASRLACTSAASALATAERPWIRVPSRCRPVSSSRMARITPLTSALSARLKIGQVLAVRVEEADHVDHVPEERAGCPEDPVGEVAERTAEHQAQRDRPGQRAQPGGHPTDPADHPDGDQRKDPGVVGAEAEGRPAVADQGEVDRAAEQSYRLARRSSVDRASCLVPRSARRTSTAVATRIVIARRRPTPTFGTAVSDLAGRTAVICSPSTFSGTAFTRGDAARRLGAAGVCPEPPEPVAQRRSSNCLHETHRVADGNAASRSTGIGLPHFSHQP